MYFWRVTEGDGVIPSKYINSFPLETGKFRIEKPNLVFFYGLVTWGTGIDSLKTPTHWVKEGVASDVSKSELAVGLET